ncbi:MAG TPA: Crp/Fnr family transcriptional regulator [Vicinamibacterales bacterium]|nr:Crp/Fnr family transcriptional regulator [Vicinamibacterales bacterium]
MLDSLDDAERRDVVAAANSLQLKTHDILAQQGAPAAHFYVIEVGRLRLSWTTESGEETAARTVGAGQSFGGSMLLGRPRYLQSARAQQPTRVLAWARPTLLALIDKYPDLKARIVDAESHPNAVPRVRLEDPADSTVVERLAHVLTRLAENGARQDDGAVDIMHPLTRHDLALLVGAEPREVSTLLTAWESERVVQLSPSHVRLLDEARLEALAAAAGTPQQESGRR